ncbi:hypothetical protein [Pantoea ananatis]|uniref:hypothetical protein n=1 Tax=Pantoea ananas TaxID=553 RepID=UPI0021E7D8F5|nr:hypothetical protein [Pantoea ananatis]MCW0309940.1 hypothetical protein [Pantoea ananatis]MCW0341646.1 hypothetical protein [Pantoea ananatis]MCW0360078.1 hypothetical protein [Pantoea ananatis]MCW0364741.1 hypothetical protein [Pantoea ananatis]MCW1777393.1 hypothetical protein [Pantoea ananatis]
MHDVDPMKLLQVLSALAVGGVIGWFCSHLLRAKLPATVLIMLAWMGLAVFSVW